MNHYLFEDFETGEEFIVGAEEFEDALDVAYQNFAEPRYRFRISEFEAEMSGLDEY